MYVLKYCFNDYSHETYPGRHERQVMRGNRRGVILYLRVHHIVGGQITVGDFYGALGTLYLSS